MLYCVSPSFHGAIAGRNFGPVPYKEVAEQRNASERIQNLVAFSACGRCELSHEAVPAFFPCVPRIVA